MQSLNNDSITEVKYSTKTKLLQLSIHQLVSSQKYQRDLDELDKRLVSSIARNFDPHKLGVLEVSYRNGKYYVFDGQHRLAGLLRRFRNEDFYVNCNVHFDLSYEDEARYFAEQNKGVAKLTPYQTMNGYIEAKDKDAMEIQATLNSVGLRLARSRNDVCDNAIVCVRLITRLHKKFPLEDFEAIIRLVKTTWNGDKESLDGRVIGGTAVFYEAYKDMFDPSRFIKSLRVVRPREIIVLGNSDLNATGDLRFAKAIYQKYNKCLREKLPYRFNG